MTKEVDTVLPQTAISVATVNKHTQVTIQLTRPQMDSSATILVKNNTVCISFMLLFHNPHKQSKRITFHSK